MPVLVWGSAIFVLTFLTHVLIWRIRLPKHQTKALLRLFFGGLAVCLCAIGAVSHWRCGAVPFAPAGAAQYAHVAMFVISLTLAYVITYSALEVDSPSLVMVMAVWRAGPDGLDEREFARRTSDDVLVRPRIRDLLRDGMVVREAGKCRLTPKGRRFVNVFIIFRAILGAPKGG
jgi:hypothetical protein